MKDRMRALAIPTLLVLITSFSYGCSAAALREKAAEMTRAALDEAKAYMAEQGKEILTSAKDFALEQGKTLLTAAAAVAAEAAEAKIAESEQKRLAELDQSLAAFKVKDPATGVERTLTWKYFDNDGDGALSPTELSTAGGFVAAELMKKVAAGEMGKDDAANTGKNVGLSLAALLALWGASKGVGMVAKKKNGTAAPPPAPTG